MSGMGDWLRAIITYRVRKRLWNEKNVKINGRSYVNYGNCEFEGCNSISKFANLNNCELGFGSYVSDYSVLINTCIGRYCAIGPYVHIVSGNHPTNCFVSIHPAFYSTVRNTGFAYVKDNQFEGVSYADYEKRWFVRIGNDVWIGHGVLIKNGVTIADGTIIAAGAVVVKDTEPYSIVGGVPAKLIRYRFNEENITFLLKLKWWDKDQNWLEKYADKFSDIENLKRVLYEDMPRGGGKDKK